MIQIQPVPCLQLDQRPDDILALIDEESRFFAVMTVV
jgi:hypothetical protein